RRPAWCALRGPSASPADHSPRRIAAVPSTRDPDRQRRARTPEARRNSRRHRQRHPRPSEILDLGRRSGTTKARRKTKVTKKNSFYKKFVVIFVSSRFQRTREPRTRTENLEPRT